jgi:thiol-disulfide isomerase/thioredoxin
MNKKITLPLISALVAIVAVGGIVYWQVESADSPVSLDESIDSTSEPEEQTPDKITSSDSTLSKNDAPATQKSTAKKPGAYINYSGSAIASTAGTKLLFFHAPWCSQCRMIESDINSQGIPDGVTVIKIDYDSNQTLRQKYGVTLQTTFVRVNDDGSLVKKFVAYDEPNFDSVKRNLL